MGGRRSKLVNAKIEKKESDRQQGESVRVKQVKSRRKGESRDCARTHGRSARAHTHAIKPERANTH
eukprot:6192218-Pleurochrysis_carterae.AAC.6